MWNNPPLGKFTAVGYPCFYKNHPSSILKRKTGVKLVYFCNPIVFKTLETAKIQLKCNTLNIHQIKLKPKYFSIHSTEECYDYSLVFIT